MAAPAHAKAAHWWEHHHHTTPDGAEIASLVAAARAALPDAALVDAQLRRGGEEPLTDMQIRRWLAARGWDPARAAADLTAHAAWRAGFAPTGRVLDSEVANDVGQGKVVMTGPDRAGRSVLVFIGKNHFPRPDQAEVQRFFCYSADAGIALSKTGGAPGVVLVFMARGFGWANFDIAGLSMLFRMVHTHYVERLAVMYIHGASRAFQILFKVVEPFVHPDTRRKVVLLPCDDDAAAEVLAADIGREALPPSLGGTAAARPIEQAWAELERSRAAAAAAPPPQEAAGQPAAPKQELGPGADANGAAANGAAANGAAAPAAAALTGQQAPGGALNGGAAVEGAAAEGPGANGGYHDDDEEGQEGAADDAVAAALLEPPALASLQLAA
ncbi:MAG: CRAL-TRIO domain-containing protein [Monoraphidium minutum]|nr:MAG: CRAL-TRIO domain-containing protein [Monoraphidium minutum]